MPLEALTGSSVYINALVKTNPVGAADFVASADDHIRGIKNVLLNTFPNVTGAVTATQAELNRLTGSQSFIATLLQAANAAAARTAIGADFEANTVALFVQSAAPTGWTKVTTHNDKALRMVSGSVSTGGSVAFATAFAASRVSLGTALTIAQIPPHNHSYFRDKYNEASGTLWMRIDPANRYEQVNIASVTGNEGGGAAHTHGLPSFAVQYVDVIHATKDA